MERNKNENVITCPPCGENVGLPTKRGAYKVTSLISPSIGPAGHFLRKGGRKGFTLIELLVVVLIIGILAAVAVPQYQKAIWRSRNVQLKTLVEQLSKAQQRYYLANGTYAEEIKDLDVDIPAWTSAKRTKNDCDFQTADKNDSVRYNDDFQIGISLAGAIYGSWISGPYKCGGFRWFTKSRVCIERQDAPFSDGKFCEQVEKASYKEQPSTWRYYQLP